MSDREVPGETVRRATAGAVPTTTDEAELVDGLTEKQHRAAKRRKRLRSYGPLIATLPAIFFVAAFLAYPIGYGFYMSLLDIDMFNFADRDFVGVANYVELFGRSDFRNAFIRTMMYVVGVVGIGMVMSMGFALTLQYAPSWARPLRAMSLVPYFISSVAVAMIWKFFVQSEGGFTTFATTVVGLDPVTWLGDPNRAMIVLVLATAWSVAPLSILLLLSGLQIVNTEMYDAAAVDGAGPFQKFIYITVPSLKPQFSVTMIWLTFAAFNSFGLIITMTGGGPGRSTEVLSLFMYNLGLRSLDYPSASAVMIMLLLLNTGFSLLYLKILPQEQPEASVRQGGSA